MELLFLSNTSFQPIRKTVKNVWWVRGLTTRSQREKMQRNLCPSNECREQQKSSSPIFYMVTPQRYRKTIFTSETCKLHEQETLEHAVAPTAETYAWRIKVVQQNSVANYSPHGENVFFECRTRQTSRYIMILHGRLPRDETFLSSASPNIMCICAFYDKEHEVVGREKKNVPTTKKTRTLVKIGVGWKRKKRRLKPPVS